MIADAKDVKGKVVVITGATSGLGQAFAIDIAKRGAIVAIAGRDETRARETKALAGGSPEIFLGDVATVGGAKALAKKILEKHPRIDVLVNNAGGSFKKESKTADGIETTFALNALGAWVIERELHGAIAAARGRVVNVATGFLDSYPLVVDELVSGPKKYGEYPAYGRAKQAVVMMTVEQSARFAKDGVTVVALHPGIIMGTRFGGGQPKVMQVIAGPILRGIGLGATLEQAQHRFHVGAFGDVPTGSYLVKGAPAPLPKQSQDAAVRAQVVALLEKLAA